METTQNREQRRAQRRTSEHKRNTQQNTHDNAQSHATQNTTRHAATHAHAVTQQRQLNSRKQHAVTHTQTSTPPAAATSRRELPVSLRRFCTKAAHDQVYSNYTQSVVRQRVTHCVVLRRSCELRVHARCTVISGLFRYTFRWGSVQVQLGVGVLDRLLPPSGSMSISGFGFCRVFRHEPSGCIVFCVSVLRRLWCVVVCCGVM